MPRYIDTMQAFDKHQKQYELYFNSVMGGALGPNAQYWAIYIFMVNSVHRDLMWPLRTNDINGYIAIVPAVLDIYSLASIDQTMPVGGCYFLTSLLQHHHRV
jgi:hypothetical protein